MPAPDLVPAFVNTCVFFEHEPAGREQLNSPADLDRWWHGLGGAALRSTAHDLDLARTLRDGLRSQLARHNDAEIPGDDAARARFEVAATRIPLRLTGDDDVLVAATDDSSPALVAVLVAVARARADGSWSRLKICRDPHCREAYRDSSRNRSRTWCSMEICGARSKQRAFVDRRRSAQG